MISCPGRFNPDKMKILFFVPYPSEGASNRYRIEQYLPYLDRQKIKYTLRPFWSRRGFSVLYKNGFYFRKFWYFLLGSVFRLLDLLRVFSHDVIFVHRETYPIFGALFESLIAFIGKPIIFDFDDALFLPVNSDSNSFIAHFRAPKRIERVIKISSQVIAGNRYLGDFAEKFNRNISIIPTPIDTDKFFPAKRKRENGLVIGWIGSITTSDFLLPLDGIFGELLQEHSRLLIKIVGGRHEGSPVERMFFKPWSLAEEHKDLESFDIGIMPMPDNEWTRGKCGFKAIMYMSMGIPCICSPVGMNKQIIRDGVNGLFASDASDWKEKLGILIRDPDLRRKIGENGRRTVEERYSLKVNAVKFLDVIKAAHGGKTDK